MLELDLAVNRDGVVEPAHAERYKELGDWIRGCYGAEMEEGFVDRVVVREDMSELGQAVKSFTVSAVGGGVWAQVYDGKGEGIGNKNIILLGEEVSGVTELKVDVTDMVGGAEEHGEVTVTGHGGRVCQ